MNYQRCLFWVMLTIGLVFWGLALVMGTQFYLAERQSRMECERFKRELNDHIEASRKTAAAEGGAVVFNIALPQPKEEDWSPVVILSVIGLAVIIVALACGLTEGMTVET